MGSYDGKELLRAEEVMEMLSMEKTAFYDFLKHQPLFPKPIEIGKTRKGQPIKRWRKRSVLAFIDLVGGE